MQNYIPLNLPTTHEKKDYIGPPQPALVQITILFHFILPRSPQA